MSSTIQVDTIKDIGGNTMISSNGSGTFTNSLPAPTSGIAASAIDSGTLADARIPNLNASKITAGTMATARLGSGTASSSTFLRGDQTYAAVSGGIFGSVGFAAYLSGALNLADFTVTDVPFQTEMLDTNNAYNPTTGVFTVPVAGKYFFGTTIMYSDTQGNMSDMQAYIAIQGSADDIQRAESTSNATTFTLNTLTWTGVSPSLSVNDTVKIMVRIDTNDGSGGELSHGTYKNTFWGYNIA